MKHFCWLALWFASATALRSASGTLPRLPSAPPNQPFTFAVLGDNRGGEDGEQPATFRTMVRAVDGSAPVLVLNTGDMIYGRATDEHQVREQWRLYREATAPLRAPMFHVPGNHDLWGETCARLYQEVLGPTYYAFDYGRARFIGLDTETERGRLGSKQWEWLKRQLSDPAPRLVFLFMHRPLFPVDGGIGSSLDLFPDERDQLHQLFRKHSSVIKGVFLGHEHLYHFHKRDGVPYYITGGGGANLYQAPELGGFHHFLLVRVDRDKVTVEVKKVGAPMNPLLAPKRVAPGELLESWEQGLFWFVWDYTATIEIAQDRATEGRRGLQLNFDLSQNAWPVLALPLRSPWDLRVFDALSMDVYVPGDLGTKLSLTAAVEGQDKHEAPSIPLQRGWNTVRTELNRPWLPENDRSAIHALNWGLTGDQEATRGSVVFDNFRGERRAPATGASQELLESWERSLLWRVADESVNAETNAQLATEGKRGLKMHFDLGECLNPTLLARLNPPWDLSRVAALTVDIHVPDDLSGDISAELSLRARETESPAPAAPLKRGWNTVRVELKQNWLPRETREAAEQLEWILFSTNKALRGWVVFDNLRAEGP